MELMLLVTVMLFVIFGLGILVLAATMRSSQISRIEDEEERRDDA